jgi:flagellar biogenesis protein FliO
MEIRGRERWEAIARLIKKLPSWAWGVAALVGLGALTLLWDTGQPSVAQDPFGPPDWSLFLSVILKLGVVLALIYIGLFLLKRWRQEGPAVAQRRLALLETLRLSPKQAVHLVHADGRVLVVGATDQTISLLTHWPDDAQGVDDAAQESYADIASRL